MEVDQSIFYKKDIQMVNNLPVINTDIIVQKDDEKQAEIERKKEEKKRKRDENALSTSIIVKTKTVKRLKINTAEAIKNYVLNKTGHYTISEETTDQTISDKTIDGQQEDDKTMDKLKENDKSMEDDKFSDCLTEQHHSYNNLDSFFSQKQESTVSTNNDDSKDLDYDPELDKVKFKYYNLLI